MPPDNKLSYGINTCFDLHNKLKYEGEKLEPDWNEYNSFNFIVTAWHLHADWLNADEGRPKLAAQKKERPKTPANMMQVVYALRDITNSSKHFYLDKPSVNKKVVTNIHGRLIGDWASYFIHGPQIGIHIGNSYYSMWDLRHIVLLYFEWIFNDLIPANKFPVEIQEHLKRCLINR